MIKHFLEFIKRKFITLVVVFIGNYWNGCYRPNSIKKFIFSMKTRYHTAVIAMVSYPSSNTLAKEFLLIKGLNRTVMLCNNKSSSLNF